MIRINTRSPRRHRRPHLRFDRRVSRPGLLCHRDEAALHPQRGAKASMLRSSVVPSLIQERIGLPPLSARTCRGSFGASSVSSDRTSRARPTRTPPRSLRVVSIRTILRLHDHLSDRMPPYLERFGDREAFGEPLHPLTELLRSLRVSPSFDRVEHDARDLGALLLLHASRRDRRSAESDA